MKSCYGNACAGSVPSRIFFDLPNDDDDFNVFKKNPLSVGVISEKKVAYIHI